MFTRSRLPRGRGPMIVIAQLSNSIKENLYLNIIIIYIFQFISVKSNKNIKLINFFL